MLKIGLTGGIGSGKTAVSEQFKRLGINIIDTDIISHELLSRNPLLVKKIVRAFDEAILDSNAMIDRRKLAQIVFSDKEQKQQLESILHPAIRDQVKQQIQDFEQLTPPPGYLIVVIPLLLETEFTDLIDRVLVVMADEKLRIERIKQRDNRTTGEIRAIISSQVKDEYRISAADDIIKNDNNFNQLESQVRQLHEKYRLLSTTR